MKQADSGEVIRNSNFNNQNSDLVFGADYSVVNVIGRHTPDLSDDSLVLYSDRAAKLGSANHENGFIKLDFDALKDARGLFLIQERQLISL